MFYERYHDFLDQCQSIFVFQQTYMGHGEATVSPVITLIILVAGVVGGLFIVVCVILFCKYCVKTKKTFRR